MRKVMFYNQQKNKFRASFLSALEWKITFHTLIGIVFLTTPALLTSQTISAGGEHSLFLCSDGKIMSSGRNVWGELGDATGSNQSSAVYVKAGASSCSVNLCNITAVSKGGYRHSLFLKSDGTVWASGNNFNGELGSGTNTNTYAPVQVKTGNSGCLTNLCNIIAIATGYNHSLFLKNDGTVWASGENIAGQLGDGTTINKNTPVQVSGMSGVKAISAGGGHSLFLKNDGTVWACGFNYDGELGDGTTTDRHSPIQITAITGSVTAISAGNEYSLFLKSDGTVWACGNNSNGQLGDGTVTSLGKTSPVQVIAGASGCTSFLCNIIGISAGGKHSVYLKNDYTVLACGSNNHGQLGDGTLVDKSSPVLVTGLTGIADIAAGNAHTVFRKSNQTVLACGNNNSGQLSDGTLIDKTTAITIAGLCTEITTAIASNFLEQLEFSVYPNPSNGAFTITVKQPTNNALIEVYNSLGALVYKQLLPKQETFINLNNEASGFYYIKVYNNYSAFTTQKIIIN